MEGAFLWVMLGTVGLGVLIAIGLLFLKDGGYDAIGKGMFGLDTEDRPRGPAPGSAAANAEAQMEIRQMVDAKNARRAARGEAPLDVDAEIAALTSAAPSRTDPALREEVRQLVMARNERRARQGKPPLDVDAEVERQLRDLSG